MSRLAHFGADASGVIMPYVALMLTVMVGLGVLALDGARYESLQTQLQKGADALALAGAAELNRLPDSITRATGAICGQVSSAGACSGVTAAATLVTNATKFDGNNVQVASLCFLSALPAGTVTTLGSCLTTSQSDQVSARFVRVVVTPVTLNTVLPASLFGGPNSVSTTAAAVAGEDTALCDIVPLFTCNPYEQQGDSYAQATQRLVDAAASNSLQRKLLILTSSQNNPGTYYPGNFGYLQPNTGGLNSNKCGAGGDGVVQAMAQSTVNVCTTQNGVSSQTGNDQNVMAALDVRFDYWRKSFKSCSSTAGYAPDLNVRKGMAPASGKNGACNPSTNSSATLAWPPGATGSYSYNSNSTAIALPLDYSLYSNGQIAPIVGTPNTNGVTIGDGNWACGDISATTSGSVTIAANSTSALLTLSGATSGMTNGMAASGTNIPSGATVSAVNDSTQQVTLAFPKTGNASITIASGTAITLPGYWSTAHAGNASALANPPAGCTTAPATPTRYAVYQYEISQGYTSDLSGGYSGGEQGGPTCNTTAAALSGRRILHVAFLNCLSLDAQSKIQGHFTDIPVAAYGKMFVTVPVDFKNINNPIVEFVGLDKQGDGFLFESVQLYR